MSPLVCSHLGLQASDIQPRQRPDQRTPVGACSQQQLRQFRASCYPYLLSAEATQQLELYGSEGVLLTFPVNATPAGVIPYLENLPAMSAMINSTQLGPAQNDSAQYPGAQPSPMPTTAAEDVWVQGPLRVTFSAAECSVPTTPGMVVVGAVQHATGCCWLGLYHNP
jgi:hypothetical protein